MPPRRSNQNIGQDSLNGRKRSKLVLCTCKITCLTLNEQTGRYGGEGEWVSPRTQARHRRDERLRRLLRLPPPDRPRDRNVEPLEEPAASGWLELIGVELDVLSQVPATNPNVPLAFLHDPLTNGPYSSTWTSHDLIITMPNQGTHALRTDAPCNWDFLRMENTLWELYGTLKTFFSEDEDDWKCAELMDTALESLQALDREKEIHWAIQRVQSQQGEPGSILLYNNERYFKAIQPMHRTVKAAALVCLVLQDVHFTSRRALQAHMGGLRDLLRTADVDERTISQIPKDPRSLASKFLLDPETTTYVVCPSCHSLYFHYATSGSKKELVNEVCQHKATPSSEPCNTPLWKKIPRGPRGFVSFPRKKYVHQSIKSWLGRMLSRPGIEDMLEARPTSPAGIDATTEIDDIWLSSGFSSLRDWSNQQYYPGPPGELRLVFSLSVDGFDPYGSKAGKQSSATTGIWMVLLNLPRHLRYLHENIYVAGVIPGPSKPSNAKINSYIQLTVDELKQFWHPGVFFTRTFKFPRGRLARAILIPLVCDLLAARQVIGYPGTTTAHYCCTACDIDIDDIQETDPREWPQKDVRHIRKFSKLWRDSESESDQEAIFEGMGWRWSPLLELEYWDPCLFTVIDSMHALDLNLLKHHCRTLFRIDVKQPAGDALRPPSKSNAVRRVYADRQDIKQLQSCQELIYYNGPALLYDLVKFHRKILYSFCLDYDIRAPGNTIVIGTRWVLAKNIVLWRKSDAQSVQKFRSRYPQLSTVQVELAADPNAPDLLGLEGETGEEEGGTGAWMDGDRNGGDDGRKDEVEEMEEVEKDNRDMSVDDQTDDQEVSSSRVPRGRKERGKLLAGQALANISRKLITVAETNVDSKHVYNQATESLLSHFLSLLAIDHEDIMKKQARGRKMLLYNRLVDKLSKAPELADRLKQTFPVIKQRRLREAKEISPFLGGDVMEQVWSDMKKTRLPSWVTPAPADWGTTTRGNLSADNWRVICCIHLPITLIRLFGRSEGRKQELIRNFMDLIMAVRIATMRRISLQQIEQYDQYIFRYTEGVKRLYPDYRILPTHHAALHIGDMLRRFGPKHSHDSPHYERYIKFFHRMNTNNKMGDLEGTYLRTSARHANLMYLLNEDQAVKTLVSNLIERMKLIEKERARGFRLIDMFAHRASTLGIQEVGQTRREDLSDRDHALLCQFLRAREPGRDIYISKSSVALDAISIENAVYATWLSTGYRDSAICFNYQNRRRAGVIQTIFAHEHASSNEETGRFYLVVLPYKPLEESEDLYRSFGFGAGFCCKTSMAEPILITPSQIISHAALTDFEHLGILHAMPLNREMLSAEADSVTALLQDQLNMD